MADAEREAFIEGAMWAHTELAAGLTEERVAELLDRGLWPPSDIFRERASARASDAYGRRDD
jgi:hypothetical protein